MILRRYPETYSGDLRLECCVDLVSGRPFPNRSANRSKQGISRWSPVAGQVKHKSTNGWFVNSILKNYCIHSPPSVETIGDSSISFVSELNTRDANLCVNL